MPVAVLDRVLEIIAPGDRRLRLRLQPQASRHRKHGAHPGVLPVAESRRVARLVRIWLMASEVSASGAEARELLFGAHPLLGGLTPVAVALRIGTDLNDVARLFAARAGGKPGRLASVSAVDQGCARLRLRQ